MVNSFFRQKGLFSRRKKKSIIYDCISFKLKKIQQYSIDDINDFYLETKV